MPSMFRESQLKGQWCTGLWADLGLFMVQHTDLLIDEQLEVSSYDVRWKQSWEMCVCPQ
jgi:hypothetical protein